MSLTNELEVLIRKEKTDLKSSQYDKSTGQYSIDSDLKCRIIKHYYSWAVIYQDIVLESIKFVVFYR